jgi:hypothetical protein
MRGLWIWFAVGCVLASPSCSQRHAQAGLKPVREPPAQPHAPKPPPIAPTSNSAKTATARPEPLQIPTADDGNAVIQAWLQAQNSGDFDAYSQLYAERFAGIKRVGHRVRRYDTRALWLADRRTMFDKPMAVEATLKGVQANRRGLALRIYQRFESGSFKDQGYKVLELVKQPDGSVRIVREEMLASSITSQHSARDPAVFAFVQQVGADLYVLLGPPPRQFEVGTPVADGSDDERYFVAPIVDEAAPELARWRGRDFQLFGYEPGCHAVASKPYLYLNYAASPIDGWPERWRDDQGNRVDLSEEEARSDLHDQPAVELAYRLDLPKDSRCISLSWFARDSGLPPARVALALSQPNPRIEQAVIAQLRNRPTLVELEHKVRSETDVDDPQLDRMLEISLYGPTVDDPRFAWATLRYICPCLMCDYNWDALVELTPGSSGVGVRVLSEEDWRAGDSLYGLVDLEGHGEYAPIVNSWGTLCLEHANLTACTRPVTE